MVSQHNEDSSTWLKMNKYKLNWHSHGGAALYYDEKEKNAHLNSQIGAKIKPSVK